MSGGSQRVPRLETGTAVRAQAGVRRRGPLPSPLLPHAPRWCTPAFAVTPLWHTRRPGSRAPDELM